MEVIDAKQLRAKLKPTKNKTPQQKKTLKEISENAYNEGLLEQLKTTRVFEPVQNIFLGQKNIRKKYLKYTIYYIEL